jgi:SAM-dependent methyltransferase
MSQRGEDLERYVPGSPWPELAYEHVARYLLAGELVRGRLTLDAGCGHGYGTHLLAAAGARVVGLERDPKVIERGTLERWIAGDLQRLPFQSGAFQRVVAFEVLEHLPNPEGFLDELRRCLAPDGILLLSTPDRAAYSEATGYRNPYHTREYSENELRESLGRRFAALQFWRQGLAAGSVFWSAAAGAGGWNVRVEDLRSYAPKPEPESAAAPYLFAVCARRADDLDCAGLAGGQVVLDRGGWMLTSHAIVQLELLNQERALKQELARAEAHIDELLADNRAKQAEIEKASRHIEHVERTLATVQTHLSNHARRLAELERERTKENP